MKKNIKTAKQAEITSQLNQLFGIKEERILFLNPRDENEPWIPPSELESIARQVSGFKTISVTHDKFISETSQIVYMASVVDNSDRTFLRSGVAKLGEQPNGEDIDVDVLASGRALGAALQAAGFNPFKSGSIIDLKEFKENFKPKSFYPQEIENHAIEDEAALRNKDLRQIHALAVEKGLWSGDDGSRYREELFQQFGVTTSAILDRTQRAAVINWLTNYSAKNYLAGVPSELHQDAMVA
ncbi:MAG: hypothetical protein M3Q99_16875 [Acidobacteriota bacterium]|nr:hypothetical protein [Acidobacteriota bacterium]